MVANKLCAAEAVNTTNFDTSDESEHLANVNCC